MDSVYYSVCASPEALADIRPWPTLALALAAVEGCASSHCIRAHQVVAYYPDGSLSVTAVGRPQMPPKRSPKPKPEDEERQRDRRNALWRERSAAKRAKLVAAGSVVAASSRPAGVVTPAAPPAPPQAAPGAKSVKAPRICSIEGCESTDYYARGWCRRCYNSWIAAKRKAERHAARKPTAPRLCGIEGCGRPHYARNYCNRHWQRARNRDTTLVSPPPQQGEGNR